MTSGADRVLAYARRVVDELLYRTPKRVDDDVLRGRTTAAIELLRQYAGPGSYWAAAARSAGERNASLLTRAGAVGALLESWIDQVEAGVVDVAGVERWAAGEVASSDLMGQVRQLLEDRQVHVAAPIMLCGAAVEIALRGVLEARGVQLGERERPSMGAYYRALRAAGLITAQDVKHFDAFAGLRNQAAHGEFDALSAERAGFMEQQAHWFLARLAELAEPGRSGAPE